MSDDVAFVVPLRFSGVDVLVQATVVSMVGSEPVSAVSGVIAAYEKAEKAVLGIAKSVAGTVEHLGHGTPSPKQVQVAFGVNVSLEGEVLVVKGTAGATLTITLTYDIAA